MRPRQDNMSRVSAIVKVLYVMSIPILAQLVISTPAIRYNYGALLNDVVYEWHQTVTRSVWDTSHTHTAKSLGLMDFDGNNDNLLFISTTSTLTPFFSSYNFV